MRGFRGAVELVIVFIAVPLILAGILSIVLTFDWGFVIYLGALLAAWLLIAYVLPMLTGVMSPREVLDGIRLQRRYETQHEGRLIPDWHDVSRLGIRRDRDLTR